MPEINNESDVSKEYVKPEKKHDDMLNPKIIYDGSVPLHHFFSETLRGDYAAKGVGMFETGSGSIDMGESKGQIVKIFLYWAVWKYTKDVPFINTGVLNGKPVEGVLLGQTSFGIGFIDAYRADVTDIAAFGANTLTGFPDQETVKGYNTDGASLVIIYSNTSLPLKTVVINEGAMGFSGQFPSTQIVSTTIEGFKAGAPVKATTSYIVGEAATVTSPDNKALFNDDIVNPSVFNSSEGMKWDTYTTDVSSLVSPGATSATAGILSDNDTLIWVAQVFSVTAPLPPTRGFDLLEEIAY